MGAVCGKQQKGNEQAAGMAHVGSLGLLQPLLRSQKACTGGITLGLGPSSLAAEAVPCRQIA